MARSLREPVWSDDPLVILPTVGSALRRIGWALRCEVAGRLDADVDAPSVDEEIRRVLAVAARTEPENEVDRVLRSVD